MPSGTKFGFRAYIFMREKADGAPREEEGRPGVERKNMKTTATPSESTPVEIRMANRHFVYYCPGLDLWAVGRTREEAEMTLKEEIRQLLMKCRAYLDPAESINGNSYTLVEIRPS